MATHHENPQLSRKQVTTKALTLIAQNDIDTLLNLLAELTTPEMSKNRKAIIPIFPKLSRFIRRNWYSRVCNHGNKNLIDIIMTNTNIAYINHIGCSCGKIINPMFLADEIVQHMSCLRFVKHILSYLPLSLRKKHIFYLNPSYRELLKRQYKSQFYMVDKIIHQKENT